MKHLHQISQPDGRVFLYLRKKGLPSVRLPDGLSDSALERHVLQLIEDLSPTTSLAKGAMAAALRAYELENPDRKAPAASTKYLYRAMLKEFEDDLGTLAASAFTPAFVNRLKGAWASHGHRRPTCACRCSGTFSSPPGGRKAEAGPLPAGGPGPPAPRAQGAAPDLVGRHFPDRDGSGPGGPETRLGPGHGGRALHRSPARRPGHHAPLRAPGWPLPVRLRKASGPGGCDRGPRARTPAAPPAEPRQGRKVKADAAPGATTARVYNVAGRPYTEDGLALELRKLVAKLHEPGRVDSPPMTSTACVTRAAWSWSWPDAATPRAPP